MSTRHPRSPGGCGSARSSALPVPLILRAPLCRSVVSPVSRCAVAPKLLEKIDQRLYGLVRSTEICHSRCHQAQFVAILRHHPQAKSWCMLFLDAHAVVCKQVGENAPITEMDDGTGLPPSQRNIICTPKPLQQGQLRIQRELQKEPA